MSTDPKSGPKTGETKVNQTALALVAVDTSKFIQYTPNHKTPHTGVYEFREEWAGPMIETLLQRHPNVKFVGFRKDDMIKVGGALEIQTDGTKTTTVAFLDALKQADKDLVQLEAAVRHAMR